jgi:camphor 5-monooxygenase
MPAAATRAADHRVPAHVPPELVVDFDIYASYPGSDEHLLAWSRLQQEHGRKIIWTPHNGGHWVALRGPGVLAVYNDPIRFSSDSFGVPVAEGEQIPLGALIVDPPEHQFYRGFLDKGMSLLVVRANEAAIRARAIDLIDGFKARGVCDFVKEFADVLPLSVFLSLVGLPLEDRQMLSAWTADTVRGADLAAREAGFTSLANYLDPVIAERRRNPGDDMFSAIATLTVDGRPLTQRETVGAAIHLCMAGLDTVASLLVFVIAYLARHPELRRQLVASPEKIPNAVAEGIRRFAIVIMSRRVRADIEFEGVRLKTNDMISAPSMLHNLDPDIYADPLRFDLDRRVGKVATFGDGIHRCPGALLGRAELTITLQEWLKRIPDFELVDEGALKVVGGIVACMESLPLRWPAT